MNVRIFWVRAMKCMCAQTRPRFILSSEGVLGGMEFEPMLTPRKKSPLPENVPRGGSNPWHCGQRAQALPTELFRPPSVELHLDINVVNETKIIPPPPHLPPPTPHPPPPHPPPQKRTSKQKPASFVCEVCIQISAQNFRLWNRNFRVMFDWLLPKIGDGFVALSGVSLDTICW